MKIKLFIMSAVLVTAIFCFAGLAKAETADTQSTIAQLQAQIAQLLAQIQLLQISQNPSATDTSWCHTFSKNLGYANSGDAEISYLHTILNKEGISYGTDGENIYSDGTASAVVSFQEKYASEILTPFGLTRGTGYVGTGTRAKINKLYGCSATISTPTTGSLFTTPANPFANCSSASGCETSGYDNVTPRISSIVAANGGDKGYIDAKDTITITFSEPIVPTTINGTLKTNSIISGISSGERGGVNVDANGFLTITGIAKFNVGIVDTKADFISQIYLDSTGKLLKITLTSGYARILKESFSNTNQIGDIIKDLNNNAMVAGSIAVPTGTFGGASASGNIAVELNIETSALESGKSVTLIWTSSNAAYCSLSSPTSSASNLLSQQTATSGRISFAEYNDSAYTLSCQDSYGNVSTDRADVVAKACKEDIYTATGYLNGVYGIYKNYCINRSVTIYSCMANQILKNTEMSNYSCDEDTKAIRSAFGYTKFLDKKFESCTPNWSCADWSACANLKQTRICSDLNNCGITTNKPAVSQSCTGVDVTSPNIISIKAIEEGASMGYVSMEDKIAITFSEPIDPTSINSSLKKGTSVTNILSTSTGGVTISTSGLLTIKGIASFDIGTATATSFKTTLALDSTGTILTITLFNGFPSTITSEDFGWASQIAGTVKDMAGNIMKATTGTITPLGTFGIVTACVDTDAGDNYFSAGTVKPLGGSAIAADFCETANTLVEYNCNPADQSTYLSNRINCPNGCVEGKCKPYVTIVSPNGGESLKRGDTKNITWNQGNVTTLSSIRVVYYTWDSFANALKESGQYVIATEVPASSGSYSWYVGGEGGTLGNTPLGNYNKIKITYLDSSTSTASEYSDNYFSIGASTSYCTDTDGGEIYGVKGTTTDLRRGTSLTDYCLYTNLTEGYCDSNSFSASIGYSCPNGCENGACK